MSADRIVTFETSDGAKIEADAYGDGPHGVVLAHGKVFDKESWSDLAMRLEKLGLRVLVPNFRGYGQSHGPENGDGYALDIVGAVEFLRNEGIEHVSLLGGSMGAVAVASAVTKGVVGDVKTLILLSPRVAGTPEKIDAGFALFVVSEGEDCADTVVAMHTAAPCEKDLMVFSGDAHAQFLFKGPHSEDLSTLIESALTR